MQLNFGVAHSVAEVHFVVAELQTGLTMAKIALHARDTSKQNRTRAYARKAYVAVLRFMPRLDPESIEAEQIPRRLAQLRSELHRLGEPL